MARVLPPAEDHHFFRGPFRAMRHRDFRLYVIGQTVSLVGTWLQSVALSWLVYRLTHSTLLMGTVQFCTLFPTLPLGPVAGFVADRYSRRWVILWMQAAMLVQAVGLAVMAFRGTISVPQIIGLALMLGLFNAFETPARQSIYVQMVGREDLANAIALNSMAFNAARVVGPSVAGVLVYQLGEAWCFAVNAASYVAVIISYLMMNPDEPERERHGSAFGHFKEGFLYTWRSRPLRSLLALSTISNFAAAPVMVLAPVFADAIFHTGSRGYGYLTGAFGLGAIAGTFRLATNRNVGAMPRVVFVAALGVGFFSMAYALAPLYLLCLMAMMACGFSVMTQLPGTNMLIQTLIGEEYRGRVMALYTMTVIGMIPLGNLAAGALAEVAGARATAMAGGVICVANGLYYGRARGTIEAALKQGQGSADSVEADGAQAR
jgi:MFS family permease